MTAPSPPVENLHTADDIASARLHLMEWHARLTVDYPETTDIWDVIRTRVAAAITARAIALGLESV